MASLADSALRLAILAVQYAAIERICSFNREAKLRLGVVFDHVDFLSATAVPALLQCLGFASPWFQQFGELGTVSSAGLSRLAEPRGDMNWPPGFRFGFALRFVPAQARRCRAVACSLQP